MRRVVIDTSEFVSSHSARPRGLGSWIFQLDRSDKEYSHHGTYTEACAGLRRYVATLPGAVQRWFVLP
jgi:hypothetical protein